MKEIVAIIRRAKVNETKTALDGIGFPSMSVSSVLGRGRQKGMMEDIDPEMVDLVPDFEREDGLGQFIPKRMLSMVVDDGAVDDVIAAIMRVNRTGRFGDGKIFVLPLETATRIRTGETGVAAL